MNEDVLEPVQDHLVIGDRVRTLQDAPDSAHWNAVAIRGGRILAVGEANDLKPLLAPDWKITELPGTTLMPGFHDAHVHLGFHGFELSHVQLADSDTLEQAIARLEARAQTATDGAWLQGSGFSLQRWGIRSPDRAVLDRAFPEIPVLLRSQDHHSAFVNGAALRAAGITADTPDPDGGRIVRREDGSASGELLERATDLVASAMPEPSQRELRDALWTGARQLASLGITTVHHMAYEPARNARALAQQASREDFPVRVWACLMQEEIEAATALGIATGQGGSRYQVGGAKFFVDGALGSLSAWMLEPYDRHGGTGMVLTDPDVLRERVGLAIAAGLTPVAHAIGDAAVRALLDTYEHHAEAWRREGLRPRVEHAQHVHPDDVARLGSLGLIASMQPLHLTFDAAAIHDTLGSRIDRAFPIRSLQAAGATLAFGSDTPVAPPDVLASLRTAHDRSGEQGQVVQAGESIDPLDAVRAYTRGPAYAIGWEARSGQLAPGFDADLVAWSHDLTQGVPEGARAVATMVAGRWTYAS